MAVLRDRPYAQFNFLVDLGTGATDGPEAGFQECSAISMSVDVIEYRNGNEKENNPRKLTGLCTGERRHAQARDHRLAGPLPVDRPDPERRSGRSPQRRHTPAERGPHGDRDDVEAPPRPDHQAHERTAERRKGRTSPWRNSRSPTSASSWHSDLQPAGTTRARRRRYVCPVAQRRYQSRGVPG